MQGHRAKALILFKNKGQGPPASQMLCHPLGGCLEAGSTRHPLRDPPRPIYAPYEHAWASPGQCLHYSQQAQA